MIYEFEITMQELPVLVSRTIQMDSNATFYDLHSVIQTVFDWENCHMHSFKVKTSIGRRSQKIEIGPARLVDGWMDSFEENGEQLFQWLRLPKDYARYTYDFGDDWRHEIVLSKIMQPEDGVIYPRCINAENIAPEEDSREEIIRGNVNPEHPDSDALVEEISYDIQERLSGMLAEIVPDPNDYWEEVLSKAKLFHRMAPWRTMDDRHVFAVVDPVTGEKLFCSVLGGEEETFGLAIYIGQEGFQSLLQILNHSTDFHEIAMNQCSLLLSFEDRNDLENEDYALDKMYDAGFRGKKSWPQFRSFIPGYAPWFLDDEEARIMSVALRQVIQVSGKIRDGMQLPDLRIENKVLARVPQTVNGEVLFENQMLDLDGYLVQETHEKVELALTELTLKRAGKWKKKLPISLEFSFEFLKFPVAENQHERPFFPIMAIALDHHSGIVVHQKIFEDDPSTADYQSELLNLLQQLGGGMPKEILVNKKTARLLEPVVKELKINMKILERLPSTREFLSEMYNQML